ARGTCASRHVVPAPALRPGDQSADRPPARTLGDVPSDAARSACTAGRRASEGCTVARARELLPLPVGRGRAGTPRRRARRVVLGAGGAARRVRAPGAGG